MRTSHRKVKKLLSVGIVAILILSTLVVVVENAEGADDSTEMLSTPGNPKPSLVSHVPIRINSDANFASQAASEGWNGSGTEADPYIIENYDINANGAGNAIYIGNVSVYFVISNCRLYNSEWLQPGNYFTGAGVSLYNTNNGNIYNVSLIDNYFGIYLFNSSSNIIKNTYIYGNKVGISLYCKSDTNKIYDNCLEKNNRGIFIDYSVSTLVRNNTLLDGGIAIYGPYLEHWNTQNIESNTVNGKPIYYWKNKTKSKLPLDAGQIIVANCTSIEIESEIINRTSYGIEVGFSSYVYINKSDISLNNDRSIYIHKSDHIYINDNTLMYNVEGISVWDSKYCYISRNRLEKNSEYGIIFYQVQSSIIYSNTIRKNYGGVRLIDCSYGLIYNNDFLYNNFQASDELYYPKIL